MKIKEIPAENRPRERLKKFGASALSDAELLAIILQKGVRGENVVDMCNRLISFYGIGNLSDLSFEELHKVYFFCWDDVPGNDSRILQKYMKDDLKMDWAKDAEISKEGNGETIIIKNGEKSAAFKLNKAEKNVILEIAGDEVRKYILKKENGKIKVYHKINGIGEAKAMQIKALFEFNKRCNLAAKCLKKIKYAKEVFEYGSQKIPDNNKEYFMVILLDSKNRIIADKIVSVGILNASLVHPREVFRDAIKDGANSIILVHNHPSDDPAPSTDDIKITETLVKTGEIIGISVIDHVIIGDTYYSFKENGKI